MVEKLNAEGRHYRDIVQIANLNEGFRKYRFPQDGGYSGDSCGVEQEALERLRKFPLYYNQSFLITEAVDTNGGPIEVLLVPKWCPELLAVRHQQRHAYEARDIPKEGETYLARVWPKHRHADQQELLILVDNPDSANRIARRKGSEIFNSHREDVGVDVEQVSQAKFIETAKRQIDEGKRLPQFILRFAVLRDYADTVNSR